MKINLNLILLLQLFINFSLAKNKYLNKEDSFSFFSLPKTKWKGREYTAPISQNIDLYKKAGFKNCKSSSCDAKVFKKIDVNKLLAKIPDYDNTNMNFPLGTFTYPPLFGLCIGDEVVRLNPIEMKMLPIFSDSKKNAARIKEKYNYEHLEDVYQCGNIYFYGIQNKRLKIKIKGSDEYQYFDLSYIHSISGLSNSLRRYFGIGSFVNGFIKVPEKLKLYERPGKTFKFFKVPEEIIKSRKLGVGVIDYKIKNNKVYIMLGSPYVSAPCGGGLYSIPKEMNGKWLEYDGPETFMKTGAC